MKQLSLIFLSLMTLSVNTFADFQYYESKDPNGTTHYSQFKPLDRPSVLRTERGYMTVDSNSTTATAPTQTNLTPEQQRIAELEAQNKAQQQEQDKERCKTLHNNLANLKVGGRIYEMDAKGERKYLDGREIELKRQQAQQAINQFCK